MDGSDFCYKVFPADCLTFVQKFAQAKAETPEVGWGAGGAPPSFSVNLIWTKGAIYAHHITTGPPPISLDVAASLKSIDVICLST